MPSIAFCLCLLMQDDTKQELEKLKNKVEDQEERLQELEKKNQELEKKQAQTTSANPATVFNPRITVIGDFLWRLDNMTVLNENGEQIDDQALLREAELDFRASIDPYADGVAIISIGQPLPNEFEIEVEEFLIIIKALPLPFWEQPPLGTQIKVGRMRTEFGTNNRLHLHDLPQSDRPAVIEEFLSDDGHIANGVSAQMFLPSPGDTALQLTLQALQGGGVAVAQDRNHPCYLANLSFFAPLADAHSLNVALIAFYGTNDEGGRRQSRVVSLDAWYRWKPLRQGEYESLIIGTQLFYADHEEPDALSSTQPFGYTAWAQYQLSARVYVGARWDQTDFLADDSMQRQKAQAYATWYMTEFFRMRASIEHTWSDDDAEDGLNTFLIELTVVFGAHPAEPFWVNK